MFLFENTGLEAIFQVRYHFYGFSLLFHIFLKLANFFNLSLAYKPLPSNKTQLHG